MSTITKVSDLPEFDIAQHIKTDADVAEYLRQVLEDGDSGGRVGPYRQGAGHD